LSAASPLLVGAAACAAGVLAVFTLGSAASTRLRSMIASACAGDNAAVGAGVGDVGSGSGSGGSVGSGGLGVGDGGVGIGVGGDIGDADFGGGVRVVVATIGDLALPVIAMIAVVAIVAHVIQTRGLWLPRRRVDDAPAVDAGAGARTRRAAFEVASGIAIGGVALGWLWWAAPRIARLPQLALTNQDDPTRATTAATIGIGPAAVGALALSALAAFAIAWVAIGVLDALWRHFEVAGALRMTPRERREDERLSAADPRWRALRARLAREPRRGSRKATQDGTGGQPAGDARTLLAGATVLLLGDDVAVAIAFDPIRQPIPTRTAVGRGVRATQLLALARRERLPIHREPNLVTALADATGLVPETQWARLAEIVAATQRSS
jgi:type III secretion system FlhB-like substrate exporter